MPFNAGVVDPTPTRRVVHFQFMDSDGKTRTDSYDILPATTDAAINAVAGELGAKSNATLYNVGYTNWYQVDIPSVADATDETNDSVQDNIVMLFKNPATNQAVDFFIPANNEGFTMVPNTENPDPALLVDLVGFVEAMLGAGYDIASYRFSERKQKNRAIKA